MIIDPYLIQLKQMLKDLKREKEEILRVHSRAAIIPRLAFLEGRMRDVEEKIRKWKVEGVYSGLSVRQPSTRKKIYDAI